MKRITLIFTVWLLVISCSPQNHHEFTSKSLPPSAISTTEGPTPQPVGEDTTGPVIEPTPVFDPQKFAIDTMNYIMTFEMAVPNDVDKSYYGYDAVANDCLSQKKGICGDRAIAMIMLMRRNNPPLPARIVGIFGLSSFGVECHASHAAVEVYYNSSWHFFDPTFGVYFTDNILSFSEVIKQKFTQQVLLGGVGTQSNKNLVLSFAQSHLGIVYGEEEYNEFTKYLYR
jgi:hypothetical protein